jgi:hypothetical protein
MLSDLDCILSLVLTLVSEVWFTVHDQIVFHFEFRSVDLYKFYSSIIDQN